MGKRIGLQTWGSDGDILPFLTLAKALADAGHTVTLVATSVDGKDYAAWGERGGFEVVMANGTDSAQNLYALTRFTDPFSELRALLRKCYDGLADGMYAASASLCSRSDMVIGHVLCHTLLTASIIYRCPRAVVALSPMVIRTRSAAPVGPDLGSVLNGMLWDIGDWVMTTTLFATAKAIRQKEGLPPIRSLQQELFTSNRLTILATSPALCLRPADWGPHIRIAGFLNVPNDEAWAMPDAMRDFLNEGPPPVYMTFGTCMQFDREENLRLFAEAAQISGKRAIIQTDGMTDGERLGDNILVVDRTPHVHIFPLCAAIVHHGGAGTTQAALLAGKPSVVMAHAYDQHDWAKRLHRANAAGKPLKRSGLTGMKLADAIQVVTASTTMRQQAERLGAQMRAENGVQQAVALIEALLGR
jgi:sterol 3beta-glucosyltransferase